MMFAGHRAEDCYQIVEIDKEFNATIYGSYHTFKRMLFVLTGLNRIQERKVLEEFKKNMDVQINTDGSVKIIINHPPRFIDSVIQIKFDNKETNDGA